ncbi:uncharacterized protein LOC135119851 isoform X2 [Zophobas morio]|uniref:uncharacterized protein LOC135119851 isoform X2 n=1 Tax=Zophobas morio TaxID=2755281 RepID=UPI0030837121
MLVQRPPIASDQPNHSFFYVASIPMDPRQDEVSPVEVYKELVNAHSKILSQSMTFSWKYVNQPSVGTRFIYMHNNLMRNSPTDGYFWPNMPATQLLKNKGINALKVSKHTGGFSATTKGLTKICYKLIGDSLFVLEYVQYLSTARPIDTFTARPLRDGFIEEKSSTLSLSQSSLPVLTEPKMPKRPFQLFFKWNKKKYKGATVEECLAEWNLLSLEEKQKWHLEAVRLATRYKADFELWRIRSNIANYPGTASTLGYARHTMGRRAFKILTQLRYDRNNNFFQEILTPFNVDRDDSRDDEELENQREEICAVVARSLQHSERYKQKTSCLPSLQELTVNSIVYREHVCCVSGMPNIGQQHVVFRCEGAYFFPTQ